MNFLPCPTKHLSKHGIRRILQSIQASRCVALGGPISSLRRCFHQSERMLAEQAAKPEITKIAESRFWKEYRETLNLDGPNFSLSHGRLINDPQLGGNEHTIVGYLTSVKTLSDSLVFGRVWSGYGSESEDNSMQIICRSPEQCAQLKSLRLHSPVSVTGTLGLKHASKKDKEKPRATKAGTYLLHQVELLPTRIKCLNTITDAHLTCEHVYPPTSRHLQIRFDTELRRRLNFRSVITSYIRNTCLNHFQEIETPILFKSTPEGAREFLVPTRRRGYAYALPQSPQQYKQILMASGIHSYFQFAKCFRDEDLRADRQPEFTQIDMEMAFADGKNVMYEVERLVKLIYDFCASWPPRHVDAEAAVIKTSLPDEPFLQMPYQHAMSKHGSDKPDIRINALISPIDSAVPAQLRGMLTSIPSAIIEAFKLRLDASPKEVQRFIRKFMDSPEAETFRSNPDGAPGICIFDSTQPVEGLQTFGFDGAEQLKEIWKDQQKTTYQEQATFESNKKFEDGDLIVIQAREKRPLSGGSTALGRLRLAIYKAAIAEGLIQPDLSHRYLWVTDFPMFTPDNASDPGQGGTAGFSATHHPFTAPKTPQDVDLLLTNPLEAKADHYDLVVNGVELGGGSRRIHNADMQKFIMRDILEMSSERITDFSHLFKALESGCPPHAGFAFGFDRFIAVLTGCESVRDVIAFPKSSKGEDMMVKSPSKMTDVELARYHLALADEA
ncbi:hypothetical protein ONS95_013871 [Cadophora gregata]|uniref:uncharacterized protein n=1 Tax=Cadophora gregata TaxID=51156 RepID=UPI0026DB626F|nr:uncharacterized protein ONS95_013871 [Cadophora gregata]KAK0113625.1 hypothetical protein ONS96_014481 [Cadophora gregata f. sp. sojae]KAK0114378.1 hypothetical protein ONS95_013871 [Cadophora gregata]